MAPKKRLQLSQEFIDYLSSNPEHGVGYQLVTVKLKNGRILKECIVLNSEFLELKVPFEVKLGDIDSIILKNKSNNF